MHIFLLRLLPPSRSHFGWKGDRLPNFGPKQQAVGLRSPSSTLTFWASYGHCSNSERCGPSGWRPHEHMRQCYLLADPCIVLFHLDKFVCLGGWGATALSLFPPVGFPLLIRHCPFAGPAGSTPTRDPRLWPATPGDEPRTSDGYCE